jgi:hypothetical protein
MGVGGSPASSGFVSVEAPSTSFLLKKMVRLGDWQHTSFSFQSRRDIGSAVLSTFCVEQCAFDCVWHMFVRTFLTMFAIRLVGW